MSGILALVDAARDRKARAAKMEAALVHTGPSRASWAGGPCVVTWRGQGPDAGRLVATDDVVIALSGTVDVDEAKDPRGEAPPYADAAVLLDAWRKHGIDLADRLDGEFVAAIWERGPGVLHIVRDRSGIRPLLWARRDDAVAVASDAHALLALPWVSRELARDHLAEYLGFRVLHPPRTLLRQVEALPPGFRLRASEGSVRLVRTWRPVYAVPGTPVPREADVVPELNAAIERSVRRRLLGGDAPGLYLSGGVGSTAVAAAARAASATLQTFTVTFAEEPFPEFPFAGRVAKLLGMDHHTVTVNSKEVADAFGEAVGALSTPNGNVAVVLQLVLARAARASVGRVMTGDGADQLFGGAMLAGPAEGLRRLQRFQQLPPLLRRGLAPVLRRSERTADLLGDPATWALDQGVGGVRLFGRAQRRGLLLDGLFVRPGVRREVLSAFYGEIDSDPLNGILHAFYRSQLGADIIPRVDATAAVNGLQVTFPLLDSRVRRLAMLLPGAFKLHGLGGSATTRWLLRALLRGALPPALINRPDRHMPRPLDDWLDGPGRLFLEERFALLREDPLRLWHVTGLEALRRALLDQQPGAAQRLWGLFIFDAWARGVRAV